jgi:hypothetical protein
MPCVFVTAISTNSWAVDADLCIQLKDTPNGISSRLDFRIESTCSDERVARMFLLNDMGMKPLA